MVSVHKYGAQLVRKMDEFGHCRPVAEIELDDRREGESRRLISCSQCEEVGAEIFTPPAARTRLSLVEMELTGRHW